jgi:hypothetical protein
MTAALRKYASTAARLGLRDLDRLNGLEPLLDDEIAKPVLRDWTGAAKPGIAPRTAAQYVTAIATVASRNGVEIGHIVKHGKTNRTLAAGRKADQEMSPKVRAFCQHLIDTPSAAREFFGLNRSLARAAKTILDEARAAGRPLGKREREAARALGTLACIAAIELYAAPLRIRNTLALHCIEPSCDPESEPAPESPPSQPQLLLPSAGTPHASILLPASAVKNDRQMPPIPLARSKAKGLQTLEWYRRNILPLYPHQAECTHLFPAVGEPGKPLAYSTVRDWFSRHVRVAGRPITPHSFRHGIASVLINRDPDKIALIAEALGDSPRTVATYYGWISPRIQMLAVQSEVLDAAEARR